MRLSSLFTQGNQQIQENSRDMSFSTLEKGLRNGMKEMEGKMPGQSVTGEVIEADGQDILLAIGKNQLLRARLSLAMDVEAGQQLTFGIKSIGGMKVVLSPLFENMTSGSGAEKALELAGLPRNEETMKMVEAMMKEGMKLDPDSLSSMYRTVNAHMDADITTLVQLNRMGLPVTEENITQLQSYKNYEGQVTEGVKILMGEVAEQLSSLAASDNPEDVFTFLKVVLGEPSGTENVQTEENMAGDDNVIQTFKNAVMTEAPEENAGKEKLPFMPGMAEQAGEKGLGMALSDVLQKAGFSEETVNACLKGELPAKELLTELGRLVKDGRLSTEQKNGILELLKDNEFLENLKKGLTEKFLLTPDEVGEDGQVEKLYERLDSQLSRMNQALQGMAKENPALSQSIQNLSSNVEFMNQLNQMFTYVQLPLKLSGQEAAGELYVYTNKKNLAKKDGQVSALLHLDLEHLGEIDIHVSLRDSHVSTKFCLSDEKALDLVAANIDTLNQRLMKRGYSMDASFEQKDKAQHPIDEMLDRDKKVSSKEKVLISSSSFDARA
ncbi:flagellar hook-length control protein FliK [Suilimivivens aceti]|uniref:Flagellar hook-length control protein FliK n=1 Tax=Suilimivivens aceti TaxID=2981774 RepID=A0ABT2SZ54_9FIRM|nr:flagellar hook-length control protein FliK [Suilimivivens aceti]MCU6743279.1 flagellar hook-length control protein FliK [Suilimivivens aceti]SCH13352.1 Flagellar hook-length control protein FliK [uncultured Clostridium sp.]